MSQLLIVGPEIDQLKESLKPIAKEKMRSVNSLVKLILLDYLKQVEEESRKEVFNG
jgi:hypothetical protein